MKKVTLISLLSAFILMGGMPAIAEDQQQMETQERSQIRDQDKIYGHHLMTEQERIEHRQRMQATKTKQERDQLRMEHRMRMDERAKARGMNPPCDDGRMMQHGKNQGSGRGK